MSREVTRVAEKALGLRRYSLNSMLDSYFRYVEGHPMSEQLTIKELAWIVRDRPEMYCPTKTDTYAAKELGFHVLSGKGHATHKRKECKIGHAPHSWWEPIGNRIALCPTCGSDRGMWSDGASPSRYARLWSSAVEIARRDGLDHKRVAELIRFGAVRGGRGKVDGRLQWYAIKDDDGLPAKAKGVRRPPASPALCAAFVAAVDAGVPPVEFGAENGFTEGQSARLLYWIRRYSNKHSASVDEHNAVDRRRLASYLMSGWAGMTSGDIADRLGVAASTVRDHVARVSNRYKLPRNPSMLEDWSSHPWPSISKHIIAQGWATEEEVGM